MNVEKIPTLPGSYALLFHLDHIASLSIGRLGVFTFPPAHYLYFGSACGPGGLRARLQRHISGSGRPHWHIDTFRSAAVLRTILYQVEPTHKSPLPARLECIWSQAAQYLPSVYIPAPHFGASDCRLGCPAHLFGLSELPGSLEDVLAQAAGVIHPAISTVPIR